MNAPERKFNVLPRPPAARWTRRRKIAAGVIVGIVAMVSIAGAALWYVQRGGDRDHSPIICSNPCELPTFSELSPAKIPV